MIVAFFIFLALGSGEAKMLVRVYDSPEAVAGLDIAGCKRGEWVDVIVTQQELNRLKGKNIEVLSYDIEELERSVKGFYHSYSGFVDTFTQIATSHPNIAKLDTIGVSWEGRKILALKISDNVWLDEDEPELLFDGLHHAREWPGLEICLFYADTLTKAYGINSHITDVVNSNEIWIVPCVNPDGYVYCHDQGNDWRKNRHPPSGIDLNRNYNGSCNGSRWGAWGSVDNGKASHVPGSQVYCGADAFSEYEAQSIRDLVSSHNFTFYITYHTYSEYVVWPWGYTGQGAPDSMILSDIGYNMAQRIERQAGGSYDAGQCYSMLYPTSGTSKEWAYGYGLYIQGMPILAYTVEACSQFQPPAGALDQVVKENFDGAIYLCDIADSIKNLLVPMIIPPVIGELDTSTSNYEISWYSHYPADKYKLDELTEFSAIEDGAEDSSDLWYFWGFKRTTSTSHGGSYSYFSDSSNNNVTSMTTQYPLPASDSLVFWCGYDIQEPNDRVFVEVSPDRREWKILDSFTGSSGSPKSGNKWQWERKSYSLPPYKSLFIRFRYTTDYSGLGTGFYVDEIYPIPKFDSITTISDNITDTFYTMTGKPSGAYWYRVQGYNPRGWGDYSQLEDIVVVTGAEEKESIKPFMFTCSPNPFSKKVKILYNLPNGYNANLKIYDIGGRLVKSFPAPNPQSPTTSIVWDAKGVADGIYFVILKTNEINRDLIYQVQKITLLR